MPPIDVIGVGADGAAGLAPHLRMKIAQCERLYGGRRLLNMFPEGDGVRVTIGSNLPEIARLLLKYRQQRQVVLATGDPNFFGVADYLYRHVGREHLNVHPHLSCIQLLFARIRESWHDAFLASVHGRSACGLTDWVRRHPKVVLLTDPVHHPGAIARRLLDQGIQNRRMVVGENLGAPGEKVTEWDLEEAAEKTFAPLNVVLIRRLPGREPEPIRKPEPVLGIKDGNFAQRAPMKGQLTKREVRAVVLARLGLSKTCVLWDIGAGSGSVGLEARGVIGEEGRVYAVERNAQDVENIRENARRLRRSLHVVHGEAPEVLESLENPDAVFIGGSGGRLDPLLSVCAGRLNPGGRLVMNAVTLENATAGYRRLQELGLDPDLIQLQVSRSRPIAGKTRLEPLTPVFLLTGEKSSGGGEAG
ncbi:precorrin-6Y C5,15-methyltransferase (decarboxylating) [Melghirimyces profundicolus]|uniref:Precorrin-6Y C5,15-methyltransferase (Decarboxylating) n=1 Tax=Melghirimyces profundicolus TaxID=1242148 RepID=A0A2T6C8E3_9BACL|nr:precorrin-6y C5,15-methyltransferase (decarboxylating) subunit CbiE [Melghirimyces profundicolus]PTX64573.1 precorrin-6Y C5,15-methyltransferase (decarboxylating) [Melghirimyces profundicolus]